MVTDAKQDDIKVAQNLFLPVSIDKAYIDFQWLYSLYQQKVYFVTRARDNLKYQVVGQQPVNKKKGLISDEEIELTGNYSRQKYPGKLRLITYYDQETKKTYQFPANNFSLCAYTITRIDKARW